MISSAGLPSARARSRSSARPLPSPSMIRRCSRSVTGRASSSAARSALVSAVVTPVEQLQEASAAGRTPAGPRSRVAGGRRPCRARPRRCSSGIRAIGTILAACTIAESRPASMHSCRKTELSTTRAAGLSPKEMLDSPRVVCTSGKSRFTSRIASIVSMPSRRVSSCPVAIGKVRQSMMMSLLPHPPVLGQVVDQPAGDPHLPLRGPGLALLVDGQRHHRRAVLDDQLHDLGEPGVGPVAVLVVDRVDHRPAAETLQPGLQHGRLGRVEHDRQGGGGGQPEGELAHVGGAVAADVVDVEVEQVRAVADLGAGDVDAVVPALGQQRLAERLRPVGVGPLADGQIAGVLAERHLGVQRGRGGRDVAGLRAGRTGRPCSRSTTCRRCSGVVPQQPPTRPRPNSPTNCSRASASCDRAAAGSGRRRRSAAADRRWACS